MVRGIDGKRAFSTEKILSLNKLCCIILTVTHTDEHAFGGEKILASRVKMPVNPTGCAALRFGVWETDGCNIGGRLSCVLFSEG